MAICSGRKKPDAYDEFDRIEEQENDSNNLWYWSTCQQDCQQDEDVFQKYTSAYTESHSGWYTDGKSTVKSRKTYTSARGKYCGGASQFPRKNFSRRRI